VEQRAAQLRPEQVLRRQIDDRAVLALEDRAGGVHPALEQAIPHHVGQRQVVVVAGRHTRELHQLKVELLDERLADRSGIEPVVNPVPFDGLNLWFSRHGPEPTLQHGVTARRVRR
jgi:hypothetical protein